MCAILEIMTIVRKSKISWVIKRDVIIAFDALQATAYPSYGASSRQPLNELRKAILKSNDNELNTWVDAIELTQKLGIIGYGTRRRKEWC